MSSPDNEPRREPSELRLRVLSGVVMAAAALAAAALGGWIFAAFWIVVAAQAAREWQDIVGDPRRGLLIGLGVAGAVAAGVLTHQSQAVLAIGLAAIVAVLGWVVASKDRLVAAAGLPYAAALVVAPIVLRDTPGAGFALIVWVFGVVWTTDIAAYFTGRHFGGPKLWPSVSPKKTWSGFVGGLAGGVLVGEAIALAAKTFGADWPFELLPSLLLAAVCSAAGQGGDLAESALKRRHGVKDSARLIPGHGGVLDRLDAFVVAACVLALAVSL